MRFYSPASITGHADRIQRRFFYAGVALSVAWIAAALVGEERIAVAISIVAAVCYGATAGIWIVAERFTK